MMTISADPILDAKMSVVEARIFDGLETAGLSQNFRAQVSNNFSDAAATLDTAAP